MQELDKLAIEIRELKREILIKKYNAGLIRFSELMKELDI